MINTFYNQPFPILDIDENYYLREQNLSDTEAFFEYYSDPQVGRHILATSPRNAIEASSEINYCRALFEQKRGIYWALARRSDNKMVGAVGLYINNQHFRGEICYDLARSLWRSGVMTRALEVVLDFSFKVIGLIRVEAITMKENTASIALLKKLGFEREGTLKKYRYYEKGFHDIEMYALTVDTSDHAANLDFNQLIT